MEPHLRLQPGQRRLTPEQEAEVVRFSEVYLQTQLSTEPVDEAEAAALLRQAYTVAGLAAPRHIQWVDGPFQLIAIWMPEGVWDGVHAEPVRWASFWETIEASALEDVWGHVYLDVGKRVAASIQGRFHHSRKDRAGNRGNVYASVYDSVRRHARADVWSNGWTTSEE